MRWEKDPWCDLCEPAFSLWPPSVCLPQFNAFYRLWGLPSCCFLSHCCSSNLAVWCWFTSYLIFPMSAGSFFSSTLPLLLRIKLPDWVFIVQCTNVFWMHRYLLWLPVESRLEVTPTLFSFFFSWMHFSNQVISERTDWLTRNVCLGFFIHLGQISLNLELI